MVHEQTPGNASDYGCHMSILMRGNEMVTGLVVPPTWARSVGHKAYRFVFGGLVFVYFVSSRPPPTYAVEHFSQPSGTAILRLQQIEQMGYINDAIAKLRKQGKLGSI